MMKINDEILIKLKEWLKEQMDNLEGCCGRDEAEREGYMYTLGKIEQFEAEQKQVKDDNTLNIQK
jgi:hypothetical protein